MHIRHPPPPVACAAAEPLQDAGEELVRRWLACLVITAPRAAIARLPLPLILEQGEAVAAAALRAIACDQELEGLRSVRVARGVVAAEALRGALWGALEERGERRGEVASRLAHVCSVLAAADPADARGAIARALAGGRPFIVTLVELDGLERLLRAELEPAALAAVQDALGTLDELVCESPGRYWLIGAGADPERVREVVAGAASHHGAALSAAVGIARWPGDGDGADELAAAAESALYVALAGG